MATRDAEERSIDFIFSLVASDRLETSLLCSLGAKFHLPPDVVERDPSVPLSLGVSAGWRTVFHVSGYEADRARADVALIVLGADPTEDPDLADLCKEKVFFVDTDRKAAVPSEAKTVPTVRGNASTGEGIFDAVKQAARVALTNLKRAEPPPMPHCVREGLHRHDKAASPALAPTGQPRIGDHIKLQINLREGLECANYPGELMRWLAMGGTVSWIADSNTVEATLVPTTDRSPKYFEGEWRAQLIRMDGWDFPWVLRALKRA
jgi:hypothetical protein